MVFGLHHFGMQSAQPQLQVQHPGAPTPIQWINQDGTHAPPSSVQQGNTQGQLSVSATSTSGQPASLQGQLHPNSANFGVPNGRRLRQDPAALLVPLSRTAVLPTCSLSWLPSSSRMTRWGSAHHPHHMASPGPPRAPGASFRGLLRAAFFCLFLLSVEFCIRRSSSSLRRQYQSGSRGSRQLIGPYDGSGDHLH